MRRIFAAVLLAFFFVQSTGFADASGRVGAVEPASVALSAILGRNVATLMTTLQTTRVFAVLTGNSERWAIMHQPPPIPVKITSRARPVFKNYLHETWSPPAGGPVIAPRVIRAIDPARAPLDAHAVMRPAPRQIFTAFAKPLERTASSAPRTMMSMSAFSYTADTTAAPTTLFYTVGGESGAVSEIMDASPSGALTNESVSEPGTTTDTWGWVSPSNVPNATSWPAQTYNVTLQVTSANANLQITEVKIYRVDSNGGPSTSGLAVVGDLAGLSQTLGSSGKLTFAVSGSAQTAAATDRIAVKFYTKNSAGNAQAFSYAAGVGASSGVNQQSGPNLTYQADTTSGPSTLFYTVGGETGAVSQIMDSSPSGSQTSESVTEPGSVTDTWGWVSPTNVPNSTSWPAQTYSVNLNVAQSNANLQITEVKVYRVDSNGGPSTSGLAVVGDLTGLTQSLGSTGVLTFNVSGAAQTASATDRLAVKFYTKNSATGNQTFAYSAGQGANSGALAPSGFGVAPSPTPAPTAPPPSPTGVNRWWTYEEGTVPGVGKYMANVGNGNLIVQANDLDIPERGIDLAFRRTYNSLSKHDASNTDNSTASIFGNGWTTTLDAHVAYAANGTVLEVYDIDGARYDYTANGSGAWIAPPGMQGTSIALTSDGCHYQWLKKQGTAYIFYAPDYSSRTCSSSAPGAGFNGRIAEILARNSNNYITFNYSWDNGVADTAAHLAGINAVHQDGQQLTLVFQNVNSTGPRELHTLTRPDGQVYTYSYDSTGNLTQVNFPGNNVSSTLWENYNYVGNHQLSEISSPRYAYSYTQTGGNPTEGSTTSFTYFSGGQIQYVQRSGFVNFVPSDGTGALLQSNIASGFQTYYQKTFSGYNAYQCATALVAGAAEVSSPGSTANTTITDSDGHSMIYTVDGCMRLTQSQISTGALWLVRNSSWDNHNNLASETDFRANETDYTYDTNGNTTSVQEPQIQTSAGLGRPIARYAFDAHNNLIAYCDPQYVWSNGTQTCSAVAGVVRYTWTLSDAAQPYGYVSDAYTNLGYHVHFTYDPSSQGGVDAGLPTQVQGDTYTQADGSTRTPTQSFVYNNLGLLTGYNKGNGAWSLSYDNLNQLTVATDPDSISSYVCFYLDGTKKYAESAYQHALDGSPSSCQATAPPYAVSYTYDADGNESSETRHHGGQYNNGASPGLPAAATTSNYYDGDDRLIEVQEPTDSSDAYTSPWLTRYLYDLSQSGAAGALPSIGGTSLNAHGNLAKIQEMLPAGTTQTTTWTPSGGLAKLSGPFSFTDLKGTAYDALDRATSQYRFVNGALEHDTHSYDATASTTGFLQSSCDALNACTTYDYDQDAENISMAFNNSTESTRAKSYDPDGRLVDISQGSNDQKSAFDADGRLTQSTQTGTFAGSPVTVGYEYYGDGLRSQLDVTSSSLTQSGLFKYVYRADGELTQHLVNAAFQSNVGAFSMSYALSNAGRLRSRTDSGSLIGTFTTNYTNDAVSGLTTSIQYPSGTIGGVEYGPEGEILGFTAPGFSGPFILTYSSRGEITTDNASGSTTYYANGVPLPLIGKTNATSQSWTWDPSMSVVVRSQQYSNQATTCSYTITSNSSTFDAAGRDVTSQVNYAPQYPRSCPGSYQVTASRTYDVENHLVSAATTNPPQAMPYKTFSYAWGADGKVQLVGSAQSTSNPPGSPTYDTAHWDGAQLLFTTDSAGHVDDLKIGTVADITPTDPAYSGLTFWDRSPNGVVAYYRNSAGTDTRYWGDGYYAVDCSNATPVCPSGMNFNQSWAGTQRFTPVGNGGLLGMNRTDGLTDGFTTIQGVRTYDAMLNAWTTPDAYQGTVHDPMSQKAYMWDNNNPVMYSDPSGYEPCANAPNDQCLGGVDWSLNERAVSAMGFVMSLFLPGGPELGAAEDVWKMSNFARGLEIEERLFVRFGEHLKPGFPTIDAAARMRGRVAALSITSIKSIDTRTNTYGRLGTLESKLRGYVNAVASFTAGRRGADEVVVADGSTERNLVLGVPDAITAAQRAIFESITEYGRSKGVNVIFVKIR